MQKVINTACLRKMLTAGVKLVELNRARIDALNVFPVPDGDTGTNMSLTFQSALKEMNSSNTNSFSELAESFSKGALKGARGNSGVISSQLIRGFCSIIASCETVDMKAYAKALKRGIEIAYTAVSKPKEGTILTVARVVAEYACEVYKKFDDFADFLSAIIVKGKEILAQTPEMLPVLKKAGVVDSGGMGLVVFYEGMLKGYNGEEIEIELSASEQSSEIDMFENADISALADIEFAYCTEFFVINLFKKTTQADIERLKERLMDMGDSVVVVGDLEFVKVHVHTNTPGLALQCALELGELDKLKIENMLEQNRQLIKALEASRKEMGMLAICAGEGFRDVFKDLLVDQVIEGGQTMNPSAEDIANACAKINAENIFIFPNNKNIILAAEQAKALVTNKKINVIPSKNIPQGLVAALAFDPEISVEENKVNMVEAITNVVSGSVTYAVRSTHLDGFDLSEGDIMGIGDKGLVAVGKDIEETALEMINKIKAEEHEVITLYYGCDVQVEKAEELQAKLQEIYAGCDVDVLYGGQPIYYYIVSVE